MPKTVKASDLQPGMVVSHKGWLLASTRRRVRYLILKVTHPNTNGGWKSGRGKRNYSSYLRPVRIDYERQDDSGQRHFFVVNDCEAFTVEAQQ